MELSVNQCRSALLLLESNVFGNWRAQAILVKLDPDPGQIADFRGKLLSAGWRESQHRSLNLREAPTYT
jgi:hypothetical protein